MMLSVWTDAVVALLLIATIAYSVILNRRLASVRKDRDKFAELAQNLNVASQRAEAAVVNLRSTTDDLNRRLEKKVEEARALGDDLAYMIERGTPIADKLANLIRSGRDGLRPDPAVDVKSASNAEPRQGHRVEPVIRQPSRAEAPRPAPARVEPIQIEPRAVARTETSKALPQPERAAATSRAERELLRALARRR
jgi:Domain of unknown function (DUF6468)